MALTDSSTIKGVTPTVDNNEFCSDGCFGFDEISIVTGHSKKIADLPYKAFMDDSHYYDSNTNTFWVQASYPLTEGCGGKDSDLCLLAIDANTGNINSQKLTNWTIYKYTPTLDSSGNLLAWIEGFDSVCKHPYDNFLFATVNLRNASATPIACIPTNVTDHEGPWVSDFSINQKLFATASGSGDVGEAQLLVFDTNTGSVVVNSALEGLGKALKSASGLFWVWNLSFLS
eukprot:TRINITY_DN598_c0_g1_i3.p1 TRINITY_DN598_c0_g1~~TRINITY_DN598_c0_g1_i3.p1  ORF type:complete len:230 (-),score=47.03 TRINITY_DN598_c0_g1_i3:64-753(-)